MSLDKSIANGSEKRKLYRGGKAVSHHCRNHSGKCLYCKGNRQYKNKKREQPNNF